MAQGDNNPNNPTAGFDHQKVRGGSKPATSNLAASGEKSSTLEWYSVNPGLVPSVDVTKRKYDKLEFNPWAVAFGGGFGAVYGADRNLTPILNAVVMRVDQYGKDGYCEFQGYIPEKDPVPNPLEYVDAGIKSWSHRLITEFRTYQGYLPQEPAINQIIKVQVPPGNNLKSPGWILSATEEHVGSSIKSAKISGDALAAAKMPQACPQISRTPGDAIGSGEKKNTSQVARSTDSWTPPARR